MSMSDDDYSDEDVDRELSGLMLLGLGPPTQQEATIDHTLPLVQNVESVQARLFPTPTLKRSPNSVYDSAFVVIEDNDKATETASPSASPSDNDKATETASPSVASAKPKPTPKQASTTEAAVHSLPALLPALFGSILSTDGRVTIQVIVADTPLVTASSRIIGKMVTLGDQEEGCFGRITHRETDELGRTVATIVSLPGVSISGLQVGDAVWWTFLKESESRSDTSESIPPPVRTTPEGYLPIDYSKLDSTIFVSLKERLHAQHYSEWQESIIGRLLNEFFIPSHDVTETEYLAFGKALNQANPPIWDVVLRQNSFPRLSTGLDSVAFRKFASAKSESMKLIYDAASTWGEILGTWGTQYPKDNGIVPLHCDLFRYQWFRSWLTLGVSEGEGAAWKIIEIRECGDNPRWAQFKIFHGDIISLAWQGSGSDHPREPRVGPFPPRLSPNCDFDPDTGIAYLKHKIMDAEGTQAHFVETRPQPGHKPEDVLTAIHTALPRRSAPCSANNPWPDKEQIRHPDSSAMKLSARRRLINFLKTGMWGFLSADDVIQDYPDEGFITKNDSNAPPDMKDQHVYCVPCCSKIKWQKSGYGCRQQIDDHIHSDIHSAITRTWEKSLEALQQYKRENGDCDVPDNYSLDPPLAIWVITQRSAYNNHKLDEERIRKLEELGFKWSLQEHSWNEKFELLQQYKRENGDCDVPTRYSDKELANWVQNQRKAYNNHKMDEEQSRKLEELGFKWKIIR